MIKRLRAPAVFDDLVARPLPSPGHQPKVL